MKSTKHSSRTVNRREVFRAGSFLAAAGLLAPGASAAARLPQRGKGPNIYQSVGI